MPGPLVPERRAAPGRGDGSAEPILADVRTAPDGHLQAPDTGPVADLDNFTGLAARLLDAPVSLVALADGDRLLSASPAGLADPWSSLGQTPLSRSLCRHTVTSGQPLVVEDVRAHPRFAENPAVGDLSVRAYAGFPLILADGDVAGALCVIDIQPRHWTPPQLSTLRDLAAAVTALLELRSTVAQQRQHDRLTGLPNRSLTVAHADQLRATPGELLAIAIGINDLGAVNDVYGTDHGDRVLKLVANRIARQLDAGDVLGRLEGDVFTVLRAGVGDQLRAVALAHGIRDAVAAEPVLVRGDQLSVSVTIGVATSTPGTPGEQLVSRAVEAMRSAKSSRDRVVLADPERAEDSAARLRIRSALRGAVAADQITVAFQPIVELSSGCTRGFEALARWRHPELGEVAPAEFIPVAEATGEIVPIGEHVLHTACRQLARWRDQSGQDLHVTVNVSPVQLAVPHLTDVLRRTLLETGLPGRALVLEITEGVFMAPGIVARRNLEAIRRLGIQIALDDFGTGYSALSYLKRFPVDVIKADRCFLDGLGADRRDLAVLRAILAIGDGMDIQVVAEGIETQRQRELLRLSGCPFGQGFLFSEPLPAERIHVGRRPLRPSEARPTPDQVLV